MRFNRSVPPCAVIPVLIYPDPSAAADWLGEAFGFTIRLRIANHRIQMKAGEGCFTIAEGNVSPNNSHTISLLCLGNSLFDFESKATFSPAECVV
jgi:uncharacterized glyoxalase superfamily protein PhnB